MGKPDVDISQIKKLIALVEAYDLDELVVEEGDLAITIRGRMAGPSSAPQVGPGVESETVGETAQAQTETSGPDAHAAQLEPEGEIVDIKAPLVGVFYRSAAPDQPPFVEAGETIEVGQKVGLIEAMKVFSPIPSEVAGVVVDVPAEDGKLVQQGDVLVRVRVNDGQQ